MTILVNEYGKLSNGVTVSEVVLCNIQGMEVRVITLGVAITHLKMKRKNKKTLDVVLGYDSLGRYLEENDAFGAVVGRHANRIKNASFIIDEKTIKVTANNGKHSLHSGPSNLVKRNFSYQILNEQTVRFVGVSPDGEEGFPGNVELTVELTLTDLNQLVLHYTAKTDKATPINITNHAFFNLNGHDSGSAMDHSLMIDSDKVTLNDEDSVPTGEFLWVNKTPFDFKTITPISTHLTDPDDQLRYGMGYDQNFVLNQSTSFKTDSKLFFAAKLVGDQSGIIMNTYTTQPGLQLYTANHLKRDTLGKENANYGPRHGVCLETQHFPASPSYPHFPDVILSPGALMDETTIYEFTEEEN